MDDHQVAVEVQNVSKSYAAVKAVNEISFEVRSGEIFGLLGPNGAGKTSTIRMILDIIRPDRGTIQVLGGPMTEAKKDRIGYLPEERGLYDDMTLEETLLFMGQLKGLSRKTAQQRLERYLKEVELWDARERQIGALSRGMSQKAQFVAATMHEPDLIIIDEPFSGLDPVNTRIIKDLIYRMQARGAAVIMSTHQMNRVEEMCGRILLMNHGRRVLYGPLDEIRKRFASHAVEVDMYGEVKDVTGISMVKHENGTYRMMLEEGIQPEEVLKRLVNQPGVTVKRFEQMETSLDEIFVQVVGRSISEEEQQVQREASA